MVSALHLLNPSNLSAVTLRPQTGDLLIQRIRDGGQSDISCPDAKKKTYSSAGHPIFLVSYTFQTHFTPHPPPFSSHTHRLYTAAVYICSFINQGFVLHHIVAANVWTSATVLDTCPHVCILLYNATHLLVSIPPKCTPVQTFTFVLPKMILFH